MPTAPSISNAGTGATDAGGAWSYNSGTGVTNGQIVILQFLQDGTTDGAVTVTGSTNIVDLSGAAGWEQIVGPNADGSFPVGSPESARQFIYIGRGSGGGSFTVGASGGNSTSEDLYIRTYSFNDVSIGTTQADVLENGSAGTTVNGTGTSTTVSDTGVTTLGTDRLALNLVALNDDASGLAAFAGESGGNWTLAVAIYESASGTDGTLGLMQATIASAGTIDGGSDTIVSMGWGVVGFALKPVPDALPPTRDPWPWLTAVSRAANW